MARSWWPFSRPKAKPEVADMHLGAAAQFQKLPLVRREFITDGEGDLWCIEIRKCSQTGTVLKGKRRL